VVYNPELWGQKHQKKHQPFEVYKLVEGEYALQQGEPYWIAEVGLGIGRYQVMSDHELQEQLTWFNQQGERHLSEAEAERQRAELEQQRAELEQQRAELEQQRAELERQRAEQEQQRAEQERQRAEQERQRREALEAFLRSQGIDPDQLPE
jgi:DNA repair exonuclease SbcCD ATPase subunit